MKRYTKSIYSIERKLMHVDVKIAFKLTSQVDWFSDYNIHDNVLLIAVLLHNGDLNCFSEREKAQSVM